MDSEHKRRAQSVGERKKGYEIFGVQAGCPVQQGVFWGVTGSQNLDGQ